MKLIYAEAVDTRYVDCVAYQPGEEPLPISVPLQDKTNVTLSSCLTLCKQRNVPYAGVVVWKHFAWFVNIK